MQSVLPAFANKAEFGTRVWPGSPHPVGVTWDGKGVNVSVFSENAERIELCLFDESGKRERARIALPEYTNQKWHGYFPDLRPGQLYGLRAYGPYVPRNGHRFNHNKLLLDPYAKRLSGQFLWNDALYGYTIGAANADLSFDERDSAPFMPKCVIVDTAYTWGNDHPPRHPWTETIIYEAHLRGFTRRNPQVPESLRGTFAAFTTAAVLDYLRELGVTAIEFLPIQSFISEAPIAARGLANYWGYNTIGFFATEPRYVGSPGIGEFKTMVKTLHEAGIEILLDVVYNHTAEGNELGPTLSFRGIDNASYYRLDGNNRRHYVDFTGCGNSFNLHHPRVLHLVMDSLRYWVEEMHVDGFRFDLATTMAREQNGVFDPFSGFLDAIRQDPVLSQAKLIAEPWDLGTDGYRLGNFPPDWAEWNDRYRDAVRRFWKGDEGQSGEIARRITGSSDFFDNKGRRTWASINYVTAHDGFTLRDLVSYNEKHNEANSEDNRDGSDANLSWNCGVEGPSEDPSIQELRARQQRNMLATLLLSEGAPMLLAGDELDRTQGGNNNAYCQDNEITWIDWQNLDRRAAKLHDFVRRLILLRRRHVAFRRGRFFHGQPIPGTKTKDITWLRRDGQERRPRDWELPHMRWLSFVLSGEAGQYHLTPRGEAEIDDTFFVIMSANHEAINQRLPKSETPASWELVFDTALADGLEGGRRYAPGGIYKVAPRSFVLLIRRERDAEKR